MIGWIVAAAVLLLLAVLLALPVSLHAQWREELTLRLGIGPFSFSLFPLEKERAGKAEKQPDTEKGQEKPKKGRGGRRAKIRPAQIRYSLQTLPPLLKRTLGRARRKLVVDLARLRVTFGGEDPADTALAYGRAQALFHAWRPFFHQIFAIRREDVQLSLDFQQERTAGEGELRLHIRLGALLWTGLRALGGLLRWYSGFKAAGAGEGQEKPEGNTSRARAA